MIHDRGFENLNTIKQQQCTCEYCQSLSVDWTKLTKTEKMVKALLLKANIMAELNSSGPAVINYVCIFQACRQQ